MDPLLADARERTPARTTDPRVSIVIPAKNEARNLEEVLPQLPCVHEVILVDGHSTDGTVETARAVLPDVRVLPQTRRGKGNALAVGFEAATGDVIVMFDADGSADPRELPSFVGTLVEGADFAKGSRNLDDGGSEDITGIRHMGNLALVRTANLLFGTRFTDLCYGYNAFWRDVLDAFALPPTNQGTGSERPDRMLWGDGFEVETLLNCRAATANLKIVEVPSVELPRIHGESNLNARVDGTRVLRTLMTEWRRHRVAAARAVIDQSGVTSRPRDFVAQVPAAPALGTPEVVEREHELMREWKRHRVAAARAVIDLTEAISSPRGSVAQEPAVPALAISEVNERDQMTDSIPWPRVGDRSDNVHSLHEDDRILRGRFELLGAGGLDEDDPVSESA